MDWSGSTHGTDEKCRRYFWLESLEGGDYLEDLGVDGTIILEWILGKKCGRVWIASCEYGNKASSIKGGEFRD